MKKTVRTLLLCVCVLMTAYPIGNMDQLVKTFSNEQGVEKVSMGGFILKLANIFQDTHGVTNIQILDFDGCTNEVKNSYTQKLKEIIKSSSYETLVSDNQGGENTKILIRVERGIIQELVVATYGNSCSLIRIRGSIKVENAKELLGSL